MRGNEEQSNISVFLGKIKPGLFRSLFFISQFNPINSIIFTISLIIFYSHSIFIMLRVSLRVSELDSNHETYKTLINYLFEYSGLNSLLQLSLTNRFISRIVIVLYLLVFFVLTIIFGMLARKINLKQFMDDHSFIIRIFSVLYYISVINCSFIFQIIFLSSFYCTEIPDPWWGYIYASSCTSTEFIVSIILSILGEILYFIIFYIFATLIIDCSPNTNIPWSSQFNFKALGFMQLQRLIEIFTLTFDSKSNLYHLLFIPSIFINGLFLWKFFTENPFYSKIAWICFSYAIGFVFSFSTISYIIRLSMSYISMIEIAFALLGSLFFALFISFILFYIKKYCNDYNIDEKIEEEEEAAEVYTTIVQDTYEASKNNDFSMDKLLGMFMFHQWKCGSNECPCKNIVINSNLKPKEDRSSQFQTIRKAFIKGISAVAALIIKKKALFNLNLLKQKSHEVVKSKTKISEKEENPRKENLSKINKFIEFNINKLIEESPRAKQIRMVAAIFSLSIMNNFFRCLYECLYIKGLLKPSLYEQFFIFSNLKVIETLILASQKGREDDKKSLTKLIQFESKHKKYLTITDRLSSVVLRFWQLFKKPQFEPNEAFELGEIIIKLNETAQRLFQKLVDIFPESSRILFEMSAYESLIMGNNLISSKYIEKVNSIDKIRSRRNEYVMGESINPYKIQDMCVSTISGSPQSIGKIIAINQKITEILDYKSQELIGQNCNLIIPPYLSAKHDKLIEEFEVTGRSNFIGSKRIALLANSSSSLVLVEIIIKVLDNLEKGVEYVIFFWKLTDYKELFKGLKLSNEKLGIIVTNMYGDIQVTNEVCLVELGIPTSLFTKHLLDDDININSLISFSTQEEEEGNDLIEGNEKGKMRQEKNVEVIKGNGTINTKIFLNFLGLEISDYEKNFVQNKVGNYNVTYSINNKEFLEGSSKFKIYYLLIEPQVNIKNDKENKPSKEYLEDATNIIENNSEGSKKEDLEIEQKNLGSEEDSSIKSKKFADLKEEIENTFSKGGNQTNYRIYNLLVVLFCIVCSIILCVLSIRQQLFLINDFTDNFNLYIRYETSSSCSSNFLLMSEMHSNSGYPYTINSTNFYNVLRNKLTEIQREALNSQNYIFDYISHKDNTFQSLEYEINFPLIDIASYGTYEIKHSMNMALSNILGKESFLKHFSYSELSSLESDEQFSIDSNYQSFIANFNNYFLRLESSNQYSQSMSYYRFNYINIIVIVTVFILTTLVTIISIRAKNDVIAKKVNSILIYNEIPKRLIDAQIQNCMQFRNLQAGLPESGDIERSMMSQMSLLKSGFPVSSSNLSLGSPNPDINENADTNRKLIVPDIIEELKTKVEENEKKIKLERVKLLKKIKTRFALHSFLLILIQLFYLSYFVFICVFEINSKKWEYWISHEIPTMQLFVIPNLAGINTILYGEESLTTSFNQTRANLVSNYVNLFNHAINSIKELKSGSDVYSQVLSHYIYQVDSDQFCSSSIDAIKTQLGTKYENRDLLNQITETMCKTYLNGLNNRGLISILFGMFQDVQVAFQTIINKKKNLQDTSLDDYSKLYNYLLNYGIYLRPIFTYSVNLSFQSGIQYFKFNITLYLGLLIGYIIGILLINFIAYRFIMMVIEKEMEQAKGVLKAMTEQIGIFILNKFKWKKKNIIEAIYNGNIH